jgi:hypothetical protein
MGRIFLSHVEEDVAVVRQLATSLEARGFSTWYYERDSLPGRDYVDQIIAAIAQAAAVVVVVSPQTFPSDNVDREITRAYDKGKPLIPLLRNVAYDEVGKRRDAWAFRFGPTTAVSLRGDALEDALGALARGFTALGIRAEAEEEIGAPQSLGTASMRSWLARPRSLALIMACAMLVVGGVLSVIRSLDNWRGLIGFLEIVAAGGIWSRVAWGRVVTLLLAVFTLFEAWPAAAFSIESYGWSLSSWAFLLSAACPLVAGVCLLMPGARRDFSKPAHAP